METPDQITVPNTPESAVSTTPPGDDLTPRQPTDDNGVAPTLIAEPNLPDPRHVWSQLIRDEHRLPGALRTRLAEAVEASPDLAGHAEPRLSVSQIASLFAETLPSLVGVERGLVPASHPAGEGFFQQGSLSDDDAARLARQQLVRTGFSRES